MIRSDKGLTLEKSFFFCCRKLPLTSPSPPHTEGEGFGSDFILKGEGGELEVILYLVQGGVTSPKGLLCLFQTPLPDDYCTVPFVRNSRYVNSVVPSLLYPEMGNYVERSNAFWVKLGQQLTMPVFKCPNITGTTERKVIYDWA